MGVELVLGPEELMQTFILQPGSPHQWGQKKDIIVGKEVSEVENTLGSQDLRGSLPLDMDHQAFGLRVPQAHPSLEMSLLDLGTAREFLVSISCKHVV